MEKHNVLVTEDKAQQLATFERVRGIAIEKALEKVKKDAKRGEASLKAAKNLKHVYRGQKAPVLYGQCSKFQKEVSYIPNTCQLDTQECFVHRKDLIND